MYEFRFLTLTPASQWGVTVPWHYKQEKVHIYWIYVNLKKDLWFVEIT